MQSTYTQKLIAITIIKTTLKVLLHVTFFQVEVIEGEYFNSVLFPFSSHVPSQEVQDIHVGKQCSHYDFCTIGNVYFQVRHTCEL